MCMYYADHFNDKIKVKQKSDCCDQDDKIVVELRPLSLFEFTAMCRCRYTTTVVLVHERMEMWNTLHHDMYICVILILF